LAVRELSDTGLVTAITRGRGEALAEAYGRHGARIHGLASRTCGASGADDVVQEIFLHLWQAPERYDPDRGSLRTYLLTQAHGRAVDAVRRDGARRVRETADGHTQSRSGAAVDAESAALERLASAEVAGVLATLPPRERRPIVLAYFGGYTYREVAVLLDEPEGTIKSRIRSGLARSKGSVR